MTDGVRAHRLATSCATVAVLLLVFGQASGDPLPESATPSGEQDSVTAPAQATQPAVPSEGQSPDTAPQTDVPPPAQQPPEPQTAPEKPAPSTETAKPPEKIAPVAPHEATGVLGKKVKGPDGKDVVGAIVDILVDGQGHSRAAIIDFGGFLGVGSRKIAVDWDLLTFRPDDVTTPVQLRLDRTQIQAAPEYKDPTQPAEVVESPAVAPTPAPAQAPVSAPEDVEHHAN
jgi:hypothetical protein